MALETMMDVGDLVTLIKFKRAILGLDLSTRRVLLTKCLEHILADDTPDLHAWFTKCLILSEHDTSDDMRKTELVSPEFWNTLYAMQNYQILQTIAGSISRLA